MLARLTGDAVKDRHEWRDKMASLTLDAADVVALPSCTRVPHSRCTALQAPQLSDYDAIPLIGECHA